jgi:hypothetical protein
MPIGKSVADKLYIHVSRLPELDTFLQQTISEALQGVTVRPDEDFNVLRVRENRDEVTLLHYPAFSPKRFLLSPAAGAFTSPPGSCGSATTPSPSIRRYCTAKNCCSHRSTPTTPPGPRSLQAPKGWDCSKTRAASGSKLTGRSSFGAAGTESLGMTSSPLATLSRATRWSPLNSSSSKWRSNGI